MGWNDKVDSIIEDLFGRDWEVRSLIQSTDRSDEYSTKNIRPDRVESLVWQSRSFGKDRERKSEKGTCFSVYRGSYLVELLKTCDF